MATYEIIIKGDGTAEGTQANRSVAPTTVAPSTEPRAENGRKIITGVAAYTLAKSFAAGIISHDIRMVGLRTGQVERQQTRQFNYQVAQRIFSFGESIATGMIAGGGAFGPAGVVVGALAGATVSAVNYTVGVRYRMNEIYAYGALENMSIGMANIRAGTLDSRGGNNRL